MSMATVYRDYGAVGGSTLPNNEINVTHQRQVYQVTHGGDGNRLPLMNRSFISFTYGGKAIEDFDLIATITNDRIDRDGYTPFNDQTTSYDILDGQQYWGTHFKSNTFSFKLATDGIDQKKLDEFLHWFSPGISRELILAEHPNRAQLARVSEPPRISLLPFEYQTVMKVSGEEFTITTTLYKGEIDLKLVMDEPHWYALDNVLGKKLVEGSTVRYVDIWEDKTVDPPQEVSIFASKDALKVLYEDGIPLGSMIENNMLLGNKAYASVEDNVESQIWSEEEIEYENNEPVGSGARIHGTLTQAEYDEIGVYTVGTSYVGKIAGAIIDVNGDGISSLANNQAGYFYYAGTAPAPTKITFTLKPVIGNDLYITVPHNKIYDKINNHTFNSSTYNSLTITSNSTQVLKFTTPNFFTSYNQAMYIFTNEINSTLDWEGLYAKIRDKVRHPAVRAWAAKVLDIYKQNSDSVVALTTLQARIKVSMSNLILDMNGSTLPVTFTFDSKTGEATGLFSYRKPSGGTLGNSEANDPFVAFGTILQNLKEDVGDMLYSNYIVIKDRNHPDVDGKIVQWRDDEFGHGFAHKVTHDCATPLTNLQIEYKYMYL